MRKIIFAMVIALLSSQGVSRAEMWPTLENYVAKCVLIVKAKAIVEKNKAVSFEVLETWKGVYDPKVFTRLTPEGRYFSFQDEHGVVNVSEGQEVVLFFTEHNQVTKGKLSHHSTAFPVRDGKIVYGATSWTLRQEFTLQDFKDKIQGRVNQEDTLMKMINALSLEQLRILKGQVDKRLEDLTEAEMKKWESRKVIPPKQPAPAK